MWFHPSSTPGGSHVVIAQDGCTSPQVLLGILRYHFRVPIKIGSPGLHSTLRAASIPARQEDFACQNSIFDCRVHEKGFLMVNCK